MHHLKTSLEFVFEGLAPVSRQYRVSLARASGITVLQHRQRNFQKSAAFFWGGGGGGLYVYTLHNF